MAQAYLCLSCGHVLGRRIGGCVLCRSKNLLHFDNAKSPALVERQRKIRGFQPQGQGSPHTAHLIVAAGLSLFMAAGWFVMNVMSSKTPAVKNTAVAATTQRLH